MSSGTWAPLELHFWFIAVLVHVTREGLNQGFWKVGEVVLFVYLTIALRTAYRDRLIMAAVKAGALVWSTSYILFAYRFILFFTALYVA